MISLDPDDVESRFTRLGIPNRFRADEKARLTTTRIVATDPDLIAFATPEDCLGLNIIKMREIRGTAPANQPSFFDHPWYLNEDFAKQDCPAGWHLLHASVIPGSISQPVDYLSSAGLKAFALPLAIEVTLMLFLHYLGTGIQLLSKKHTWCSDQASMNRFVTVGAFGKNGLFVSGHPGDFTSRGLGICGKITQSRDGASCG